MWGTAPLCSLLETNSYSHESNSQRFNFIPTFTLYLLAETVLANTKQGHGNQKQWINAGITRLGNYFNRGLRDFYLFIYFNLQWQVTSWLLIIATLMEKHIEALFALNWFTIYDRMTSIILSVYKLFQFVVHNQKPIYWIGSLFQLVHRSSHRLHL